MCCLFGLLDPNHSFSGKQKSRMMHVLARASEIRGTDATGYALIRDGKLVIRKRPVPGRMLPFRVRDNTPIVMGHTRMTTQGNASKNENIHPFSGSVAGTAFALAHNGVLWNDRELRRQYKLPKTGIETDSYIAVQLLEAQKSLDFASLKYMAEMVQGTFTFTVLTQNNDLYFVCGNSPMCLCRFNNTGLYLYASTPDILWEALNQLRFLRDKPVQINMNSGEIVKVDAEGYISRSSFDDTSLYGCAWFPEYRFIGSEYQDFIENIRFLASEEGLAPQIIDRLLQNGYTLCEIEEIIYNEDVSMECGRKGNWYGC